MYDDRQREFIKKVTGHDMNFENLSVYDLCEIEDKVGQYYTQCVMDENFKEADRCEEILDNLP